MLEVTLKKSEIAGVAPGKDFSKMSNIEQCHVAVRVLRRRGGSESKEIADAIVRGQIAFDFVVVDDVG